MSEIDGQAGVWGHGSGVEIPPRSTKQETSQKGHRMENKENDGILEIRGHEPIPLYLESPVYAWEHGELEQYRASARENIRCVRAISGLIRDSYDGWRLALPELRIQGMASDYGEDRIAFLVANSIHCASYDRRYSRQNMEWAETRFDFANLSAEYEEFRLTAGNAHPGLIDMFAKKWRELEKKEIEKVSSKMEHTDKMQQDFSGEKKNVAVTHLRR